MHVESLHTYPIKGCHRLDHDAAGVEPWGLVADRRWMIVDPDGVGITQRITPLLTRLHVVATGDGLRLSAPDRPDLVVGFPVDGKQEQVRVFSSKPYVPALVADDGGWCAEFLGRPARLVWLGDTAGRPIETHARDSDRVSFADGYPLLLTTTASLAALGDWLVEAGDEPVPMTRFRPNVVVTGAKPWAEDDWLGKRLLIGDVTFRAAKSCARCVVTTIDQETGEPGREPLRVLGQRRRIDGGLLFGINLIPDLEDGRPGLVRVGDAVLGLA